MAIQIICQHLGMQGWSSTGTLESGSTAARLALEQTWDAGPDVRSVGISLLLGWVRVWGIFVHQALAWLGHWVHGAFPEPALCTWLEDWDHKSHPGPQELATAVLCWEPGFPGAHREPIRVRRVSMVQGPALESVLKLACTSVFSPMERMSLHAGLPGLGESLMRKVRIYLPTLLNASFLISVLHLGAVIPHLEYFALM